MPTTPENTQFLIDAAEQGNTDEVRRLIPLSDPKYARSSALRIAAQNGHVQCVALLIPVSDPKEWDNFALQAAAVSGHSKCVELLIPVSEPKCDDSYALYRAVENGHTQCVDLLYPVSDPVVALKKLQDKYPDDYTRWGQLQQRVDAERVQHTLNAEIAPATGVKMQRKM